MPRLGRTHRKAVQRAMQAAGVSRAVARRQLWQPKRTEPITRRKAIVLATAERVAKRREAEAAA